MPITETLHRVKVQRCLQWKDVGKCRWLRDDGASAVSRFAVNNGSPGFATRQSSCMLSYV